MNGKIKMKTLFAAMRNRDIDTFKSMIEKNSALVNCVAKAPPKKDDGQSILQVAFKSKNFWAVKFLLEHDADVNFMDNDSVNEWKMPVLHDAIMATVDMARFEFPVNPWDDEKKDIYALEGNKENFDKSMILFNMMLDKGADVNAIDSYGNSSLMRLCADITNRQTNRQRPLAVETVNDLKQIFNALIQKGADLNYSNASRKSVIAQNSELLKQFELI